MGRREDHPGAFATRQQQDHARRLHADRELARAIRTEQGCSDDCARRWATKVGTEQKQAYKRRKIAIRLLCSDLLVT